MKEEIRFERERLSEQCVMLASVDPVAKEAGKAHEGRASHLETPGPLDGDLSHHPQRQFRCAEANQALNEEAPAHEREHERYRTKCYETRR